jgi:hypothetical protein
VVLSDIYADFGSALVMAGFLRGIYRCTMDVAQDVSEGFVWYAVTETGERIGFDMCFSPDCGRHLSRCVCEDGPTPPRLGPTARLVSVEATPSAAA